MYCLRTQSYVYLYTKAKVHKKQQKKAFLTLFC